MYAAVDFLTAAGAPARLMASQMRWWLDNPLLRNNPYTRALAATCEFVEHSAMRHVRPDFGIKSTEVDGVVVDVGEEVVRRHPFCNLLHFRKDALTEQPRVLLVAPLSGHFATLLRDTVATFLPEYDVYITDWQNARDVPLLCGHFGIEESIDVIIDHLRFLENCHVVAVCQPSVTVFAAATILAEQSSEAQPKTMTLMGGPIDARIHPTAVNNFAMLHPLSWYERLMTHVPFPHLGAGRKVYPGFVQLAGFMAMNPDRHLKAYQDMFNHLVRGDGDSAAATRAFYNEYTSVMDLPAEFYVDCLVRVFREHHLASGRFLYRGRAIEPHAVKKTPVLIVEGQRDDICGIGQTRAALDLLTGLSDRKKFYHLQEGAGHYALFHGKRWRGSIYPKIREMIQANN